MSLLDRIDCYKAAIDKLRPFEGDLLAQIKSYYRIGLTWTSNALEGNTLTESETKVLLEDGLTVGGKPLRDTFEALGHANAYDFMFTLLSRREITEEDALTMHRMFYAVYCIIACAGAGDDTIDGTYTGTVYFKIAVEPT